MPIKFNRISLNLANHPLPRPGLAVSNILSRPLICPANYATSSYEFYNFNLPGSRLWTLIARFNALPYSNVLNLAYFFHFDQIVSVSSRSLFITSLIVFSVFPNICREVHCLLVTMLTKFHNVHEKLLHERHNTFVSNCKLSWLDYNWLSLHSKIKRLAKNWKRMEMKTFLSKVFSGKFFYLSLKNAFVNEWEYGYNLINYGTNYS